MKSKFFVVLLAALSVGTLIIFSYKENVLKTYPSFKTSSIKGFHLTHREGDKIKWELKSENATFPAGNKEIFLEDLTMQIHHDHEFILKGGGGIYNIEGGNLTINKPVEINIEGAKLTTDSLRWNIKDGLITTKNNIKFKGKNFLIEGTGLTAEIKNQQIRILENVKGIFYP